MSLNGTTEILDHYVVKPTQLKKSFLYVLMTLPMWMMINHIIPIILLIVMNVKLSRVLRDRSKVSRGNILTQVIIFFKVLICQSVTAARWAPHFHEVL